MAISASTAWRIRAGGSNVNGGGFDSAVSGVLATTLNGSLTNSTTTVVVASASGWPGSGNYYARIGNLGAETFSSGGTGSSEIVLVTAGQGTVYVVNAGAGADPYGVSASPFIEKSATFGAGTPYDGIYGVLTLDGRKLTITTYGLAAAGNDHPSHPARTELHLVLVHPDQQGRAGRSGG